MLLLASCATMPSVSPQVRADLAPTGKLRAGINYANTVIATKDLVTGELRGVSVDLMRELARRLNVPLELVGFDFSGKLADALNVGELDIGGISGGSGSGREGAMDFTAGYVQVETTYLREFIEEAKAAGSIARSLANSGNADVPVSPAAAAK